MLAITLKITNPHLLDNYAKFLKTYSFQPTRNQSKQVKNALTSTIGKPVTQSSQKSSFKDEFNISDTEYAKLNDFVINKDKTKSTSEVLNRLSVSDPVQSYFLSEIVKHSNEAVLQNPAPIIQQLQKFLDTMDPVKQGEEIKSLEQLLNVIDSDLKYTNLSNKETSSFLEHYLTPKFLASAVPKIPSLFLKYYNRAKVFNISFVGTGSAQTYLLRFSQKDLSSSDFIFEYNKSSIDLSLSDKFQGKIAKAQEKALKSIAQDYIDDFEEKFGKVDGLRPVNYIRKGSKAITIDAISDPANVAQGKIPKQKLAKKLFINTAAFRSVLDSLRKEQFISNIVLNETIKQQILSRMPKGPIGGPPLSPTVLTYRTGRFWDSIKIAVDYRRNLVRYMYNPIYFSHEITPRDPRKLITGSIQEVLAKHFARKFNIIKS